MATWVKQALDGCPHEHCDIEPEALAAVINGEATALAVTCSDCGARLHATGVEIKSVKEELHVGEGVEVVEIPLRVLQTEEDGDGQTN